MTENQRFYYGGAEFPLTQATTNSLLRDADPAIFYGLEFFASVIETHLGARLLAEATACGATRIASAVAMAVPVDPERYITEQHIKFPLLTLHRKSTTYRYQSTRRVAIHKLELAYAFPPLKPGEAERMQPMLHAVGLVIDKAATRGKDPGYTPSDPSGAAGDFVWAYARAGISKVRVTESSIGGFVPAAGDLFFPALTMSLEMEELGDEDADDGSWSALDGVDLTIDHRAPDGTIVDTVAEVKLDPPPTLVSVTPTSGIAAGATAVTVAGTGFRPGTRPVVLFDGAAADAVTVVNATTITCLTPPHAAYPSFVADVTVINADGKSATLEDAFTFNA